MFFKGIPSEKKYSQDNFWEIHYFLKISIVKVLLSNLLSKKGMSYVTYPVRERVKDSITVVECRGLRITPSVVRSARIRSRSFSPTAENLERFRILQTISESFTKVLSPFPPLTEVSGQLRRKSYAEVWLPNVRCAGYLRNGAFPGTFRMQYVEDDAPADELFQLFLSIF